MENRRIIIILLAVIILLLVVFASVFFVSQSKEESILAFEDVTLEDGNPLIAVLTDSQGNPISDAEINFKISDDAVNDEVVFTDSQGRAKLELGEGQYSVQCTFEGNDRYRNAVAADTIDVEEITTESINSERTDTYPEYNSDLGYYKSAGIVQDEMMVVELDDGRYVIIAGDGYYNYEGMDSQGNIRMGSFLGHGGTKIG